MAPLIGAARRFAPNKDVLLTRPLTTSVLTSTRPTNQMMNGVTHEKTVMVAAMGESLSSMRTFELHRSTPASPFSQSISQQASNTAAAAAVKQRTTSTTSVGRHIAGLTPVVMSSLSSDATTSSLPSSSSSSIAPFHVPRHQSRPKVLKEYASPSKRYICDVGLLMKHDRSCGGMLYSSITMESKSEKKRIIAHTSDAKDVENWQNRVRFHDNAVTAAPALG
jgi:hypothetical protein